MRKRSSRSSIEVSSGAVAMMSFLSLDWTESMRRHRVQFTETSSSGADGGREQWLGIYAIEAGHRRTWGGPR